MGSSVKAEEWIAKEGRKPKSNWGIVFVVAVWYLLRSDLAVLGITLLWRGKGGFAGLGRPLSLVLQLTAAANDKDSGECAERRAGIKGRRSPEVFPEQPSHQVGERHRNARDQVEKPNAVPVRSAGTVWATITASKPCVMPRAGSTGSPEQHRRPLVALGKHHVGQDHEAEADDAQAHGSWSRSASRRGKRAACRPRSWRPSPAVPGPGSYHLARVQYQEGFAEACQGEHAATSVDVRSASGLSTVATPPLGARSSSPSKFGEIPIWKNLYTQVVQNTHEHATLLVCPTGYDSFCCTCSSPPCQCKALRG